MAQCGRGRGGCSPWWRAESLTADRLIPLDGCFNFRDLGGYAGAGGRPVRWGRLYRADALQRLSDADLARLAELDIRHVIDLRTPGELDEQGRIIWPGRDLGYRNLPMMDVLPDTKDFNRTWATSEGVSARREAWAGWATHRRRPRPHGARVRAASTAAMVHASPQTMAAFLAGVRQAHGGVSAYTASLGLPDVAVRLREVLLEGDVATRAGRHP